MKAAVAALTVLSLLAAIPAVAEDDYVFKVTVSGMS